MVHVKYDRPRMVMSIKGHAGFATEGQDIVCAASSILACTAIAAVQDNAEKFFPAITQSKKDAEMRVECKPEGGNKSSCRRVLDTIFTGYELLAGEYPDHVKVEKED